MPSRSLMQKGENAPAGSCVSRHDGYPVRAINLTATSPFGGFQDRLALLGAHGGGQCRASALRDQALPHAVGIGDLIAQAPVFVVRHG